MTTAMIRPMNVSCSVMGSAVATLSVTEMDPAPYVPRSPWHMLTRNLPYWMIHGSFRPFAARYASSCSCVAPSPNAEYAVSMGENDMRK